MTADAQGILDRLERLSRNLWWTWDAAAPELWDLVAEGAPASRRDELRRNPFLLLRKLPARSRERLTQSSELQGLLREVEKRLRRATRPLAPPEGLSRRRPVAYFSMEYGLHESLPIYAGGLGILAGDHLKSASDLGVPLVAVGLLYRRGYFLQRIDQSGHQQVVYPRADFDSLPMETVQQPAGRELRVRVELPERTVSLRVWRVLVGRVPLFLLDADVPENRARDRKITQRLYVGCRETRIAQEVIAGVGGVRLLRALGIRPGVWHLNEGHVAFLLLERLRELRQRGLQPAEALEVMAADTVFTTHTPVPEGNEVFDLALAERYLRSHTSAAGIAAEDFLRLGFDHDADGRPGLSLTVLALNASRFRNGVSELHGEVSRRMWSKLWPGFRPEEVPVASITNGIHTETWTAPSLATLYQEHLGAEWPALTLDGDLWRKARRIPDRALWEAKQALREEMVGFVRRRTAERLKRHGWSEARCRRATDELLDPRTFTIGFARRFALYKRADLLFLDLKRAAALFNSKKHPVQIIYAGKPHPEDSQGKILFEKIAKLARRTPFRGKVVLLENYDMEVGRYLVRGVDLWLNTPRRPLEASGTSGQKVPANAGLNLSILDGWWREGYSPASGWAFGKDKEYADTRQQDREDVVELLRVLRHEVLPLYYQRDSRGVPRAWLRKVKSSLELLVPRFSTHRMVQEYVERLYRPALENGRLLRASRFELAKELAGWRDAVERSWPLVHVRAVRTIPRSRGDIEVEIYLAGLLPDDLACVDEGGTLLPITAAGRTVEGAHRVRVRVGTRRTGRPRRLRLFPTHPELVHPQELGWSLGLEA